MSWPNVAATTLLLMSSLANAQVPTAADVANRAVGAFASEPFTAYAWHYDYGSAVRCGKLSTAASAGREVRYFPIYVASSAQIMVSAAYDVSRQFSQGWASVMDRRLDSFLSNSSSEAGRILANETLPFDSAVGDHLGLYPIAFLSRAQYYNLSMSSPEWRVAIATADRYVLGWPTRLADGTGVFSRSAGWPGQPSGPTFLWCDDTFMGLALITRLAAAGAPNAAAYIELAVNVTLAFAAYVEDPVTGLYFHGFNYATRTASCCKWGRANGWVLVHFTELLAALPMTHERYGDVLAAFRRHASAILAVQDATDGRWHQVLDDPTTFLETSVSAMSLYALARGALSGWLAAGPGSALDVAVRKAWPPVASQVAADGTVALICTGTGILTSVAQYNARPTPYLTSSPGLGHVFRATVAYAQYVAAYGN